MHCPNNLDRYDGGIHIIKEVQTQILFTALDIEC